MSHGHLYISCLEPLSLATDLQLARHRREFVQFVEDMEKKTCPARRFATRPLEQEEGGRRLRLCGFPSQAQRGAAHRCATAKRLLSCKS